uniref:Uncharacterized protein n=1 Tax=Arundo donax TaxID=35708 RepID=A0A0A9HNR2_ARUDO
MKTGGNPCDRKKIRTPYGRIPVSLCYWDPDVGSFRNVDAAELYVIQSFSCHERCWWVQAEGLLDHHCKRFQFPEHVGVQWVSLTNI